MKKTFARFSEQKRSKAKAFFKAVARRRQQKTRSHSRKPSHQRERSRALKAVYAKGKRTIPQLKFPTSPKQTHLLFKSIGKPKRSNRSAKPSKKTTQEVAQSRYKLKTQSKSRGCARR